MLGREVPKMQKVPHYKRCVIDARAHERADEPGWVAEVYIAEDKGFCLTDTPFYLGETFNTAEEAIAAALEFAKQKIDAGIVPTTIVKLYAKH